MRLAARAALEVQHIVDHGEVPGLSIAMSSTNIVFAAVLPDWSTCETEACVMFRLATSTPVSSWKIGVASMQR